MQAKVSNNILNPPQLSLTDSVKCLTLLYSLFITMTSAPEVTSVNMTHFMMNGNPIKRPCELVQYFILFPLKSMFILVIKGPGSLRQVFQTEATPLL